MKSNMWSKRPLWVSVFAEEISFHFLFQRYDPETFGGQVIPTPKMLRKGASRQLLNHLRQMLLVTDRTFESTDHPPPPNGEEAMNGKEPTVMP